MPNHVINEVTLHDVRRDEVQLLIGSQDSSVDFRVLLPLSKHFWRGSAGTVHKEAFPGNHLDEALQKWGTKWNAYGNPQVEQCGADYVLTFQTAWGTPRGWICALFNSTKCDITVKWLSEGFESGWREHFVQNGPFGPEWQKEEIIKGTTAHSGLHSLLWGCESFDDDDTPSTPSKDKTP